MDVLYLVFDHRGEHGLSLFHASEDHDEAMRRAEHSKGVVIGIPINYMIADFRPPVAER